MIDRLIEVDTHAIRSAKGVAGILREARHQAHGLREFRFEIAIDFQGLLKSAAIAKVSGAKRRWGFTRRALREPAGRILLTDTVPASPHSHVTMKSLELARGVLPFLASDAPIEYPVFTDERDRAEASNIAAAAGGSFAILNPGGGFVTKLWHAEKFGRLADRLWDELGIVSLVAAGPDGTELADRVIAASHSGKASIIQTGLKSFYELTKLASVYVGGDTGPTHVAIAAGAPVVGIYGPTEWWRNGSLNPADICVERTDIGCRINCYRRTCGKWICMDIDVETVLASVKLRMEARKSDPGISFSGRSVELV
jgi:ADP-heptose:LPS heptosyltransferase